MTVTEHACHLTNVDTVEMTAVFPSAICPKSVNILTVKSKGYGRNTKDPEQIISLKKNSIGYIKNLCFLIFAHASTKVSVITFSVCTQNTLGSDNTLVSFIVYEVHNAFAPRKYVHELFSLACYARQVSFHFHFRQASFGFGWYLFFEVIIIICNFMPYKYSLC